MRVQAALELGAVSTKSSMPLEEEKIQVEAEVVEALPSDKVEVELSAYDSSRGRITHRHR